MFFERAIRDELEARLSMEADLARAVESDELELFYQPQVGLKDGKLVGAEALIRWRHPQRGLVAPAEFMPIVNASSRSATVSGRTLPAPMVWGSRACSSSAASTARSSASRPACCPIGHA